MQNHDLERYNSLKQKEEKDDEKLQEMILDLNMERKQRKDVPSSTNQREG